MLERVPTLEEGGARNNACTGKEGAFSAPGGPVARGPGAERLNTTPRAEREPPRTQRKRREGRPAESRGEEIGRLC